MKIKEIRIKDFRGFPGPGEYAFLLNDKNLLLYGENGSGKSTLSRALQEFLNTDGTAKDFKAHKNIFSDKSGPPVTDGHVTLVLSGNAGDRPLKWEYGGARHSGDPDVKEAALRARFLDYRSLLRTNFATETLNKQMFDLAVNSLFSNIPYAPPGGEEHLLGKYWDDVKSRIAEVDQAKRARTPGLKGPLKEQPRRYAAAGQAANLFSDAITGLKPAITGETQRILDKYFRDLDITGFDLQFAGLTYKKEINAVEGDSLGIGVDFRHEEIANHPSFLNEARLSAIALAVYVASIKLGTPPAPAGGDVLRLLVLDDVLIGLDMAHRRPVLDLITEEFGDWQVALMTFDRAWYEIAKQSFDSSRWVHYELYAVRVDTYERPVLVPDDDNLLRALAFLESGHVKAAAVHVRSEFEHVLKHACQELRAQVRYERNARRLEASELWGALKGKRIDFRPPMVIAFDAKHRPHPHQPKTRKIEVVYEALRKRIDDGLTWVLNPLSHDDSMDRYRREIEDAIFAVDDLRSCVDEAIRGDVQVRYESYTALVSLLKSKTEAGEGGAV